MQAFPDIRSVFHMEKTCKLSYHKNFRRKFVGNRNDKNSDTYE